MKLHITTVLLVFTVLTCSTGASMGDTAYARTATDSENAPVYEWFGLAGIRHPVIYAGGMTFATNMDSDGSSVNENFTVQHIIFGEDNDSKPLFHDLSQTQIGILSCSYESDLLKITVGEWSSSGWNYQYDPVGDPGNFIRSVFGEHYAVATDIWGSVIRSSYFTIDTPFGSEDAPDTATLHYDNLSLTRQVTPPEGSARSFSITSVLTNTGDSTLENVRFFQGVDYDIYDSGNDYAWYSETSDTVWQNDDDYFKNGFHGSRTSSHHDCNHYGSMWGDMHRGNLNDLTKYPESGTADCGIALQWDVGNLAPQASWDLTITFSFGEAAGIEANAGPDQNAGRGQPVTLNASGSSSVGNITTYEWDFDDDGVYDVSVSAPVYVYEGGWAELGEHTVTLRVTDDAGRSDTDTAKITVVSNVDLTVTNISFTPTEINDGDTVIFSAMVENIGNDAATDDFYVRFEVDGTYIGRKSISSLLAGSNTTITRNWIACAGSHNVTVCADEYNVITESNETNNKISKDLPSVRFPDLTAAHITWTPTDLVGGDAVTFTATVGNIGSGNTDKDFYVQFEVDGKYIGGKTVSGLGSGSSADVTQTWTATWADTVNVSVDEYDVVAESNETNNMVSKDLPGLPYPDLSVTHLTWEPKENVDAGDPVTFTATIENMGGTFYSTMSSPLKVAFLVNDEPVGSRNIVGGIRAGQPLNTTFTWMAQPGTNPAISIKADHPNTIPESDETNNDYAETLALVIKSPDLTITQLTFEPTGSIHVGDTVKFTAKVENVGEGNYNGNFDIGFYVDDAYAGISHVIDGVPAGESISGTFNWTASSCSNPVIKSKADFFDSVLESDEENNEKTETLPASIPYADLEIVSINWTPTENINDRDPVTFNVTVKNNGPENVVTDFKVYLDIDEYFTRTNVISGGLAAGESTTTAFTWKATPGEGHNATANVDPDSIVPESDETNNKKIQLLPCNVSLVEIFEVRVKPAEITTGIGGQTSCEIKINNYGSASGNFDINVSGLDSDWYTFGETSVYLSAGQEDVIDLTISVPEACENNGTFPFEVSVTSQETGVTRQDSANLIVEPTPVIHDLLPGDGVSLGSDDVTFSWNTHINSSSTIYLKSEDETDYTSYTGVEGQFHTVVVSNLARNKDYSYYAESASPCGAFNSSIRTFYIGNGICFTRDVYEITVERDYDQHVTIGVRNTDNEYHELLVGVPTTYEDIVLGFVGDGSKDNIIPLNPGESKDIALAVHLQDAMKEDYELMANLTSTRGDETLTDTARIKIHVHVPRIDYDIKEISADEITLMQTFRLTNKGDPVTDLTVSVADNLKENAYIEPVIEHYRLGEGASVEFNVIPILSSPDFQPASPVPPVEGDITVNAAGIEARIEVCFTIPEGKQPYKAIVGGSGTMSGSGINAAASSPGIINIGHVKTWHCNNRPNTKTPFDVHSGAKDKVIDDPLIIRFSSPGWEGEVKPHDLYININGHEVGSLINTVPDGYYKFEVDPSFLTYPERGVAKNYIELHSIHQNGGHYAVSSDMEVRLNLKNYETWVIASSQEEANQIAADNLPPGFYESPDSITIGDVEIIPEEGGPAMLGATAATSNEVHLGKETTIQTTAEPHLDVDARFSNGDKTVHLTEVSSGVYRGRWTPRNHGDPSTGQCVITIRAKGSGVQNERTQTAEIINPTKLKVEILEPDEGFTASVGDAIDVLVKVTRTDDQGREYGIPDSFEIDITARFDIDSSPTSVTACGATYTAKDSGSGLTGSSDDNNVIAECPGECYITATVVDNKGNRGSDSVSGKVEEEIFLQVIYPPSNFEVLEYCDSWTEGGPAQRIRVKVINSDLKDVNGAQVTAEITTPNDAPQFYPEGEAGIYYADWKPKPNGEKPLSCTIKLSAKKKFDFDEIAAHPQQVTGTVDPVIKITDIKPKGVYHRTSEGYIPLPTGGLRGNTYDPLWDDKPVNPTDDDYVAFTYKLNKDVDEVTITEYKDVTWPSPNEYIFGSTYLGGCEEAHEGTHKYYMNVKDFGEYQYFIKVKTLKKYDTPAGKETDEEEEDEDSDVNIQIERESFGQIYIEKVADVPVGKMTEDQFLSSGSGWRNGRNVVNGIVVPTIISGATGGPIGIAYGVMLSLASLAIDFDDLDTLGVIRETYSSNGYLKRLDRAESVRFTGRLYEWDGAKYQSGDSIDWLNGEYIYSNLYRAIYHQLDEGKLVGTEFLDNSPHDFLARKVDKRWHAMFYGSGRSVDIQWDSFTLQPAKFLGLNRFWGWKLYNHDSPNNDFYSRVYFKKYRRYGYSQFYKSSQGDKNLFHGNDMIDPALSAKNIGTFTDSAGATFNGLYSDHGNDTDGDGIYDYLTIEVGLNVITPGYYAISGLLADANGELIDVQENGVDLPSGVQTMEINFSGMSIRQNEVNGIFSVVHLSLYNKTGSEIDYRFNFTDGIYHTALYNYAEFQLPNISFTDNYSEEIVDTDGDRLYDYLIINIEVNVSDAGNYGIVGWLSGDEHKSIVQNQNSSQLNTGLHNIQLGFDGTIIRQKGVDGPYNLSVNAYDGNLHIIGHSYDAYTTAPHHGSDFQRTAAEFNDVYLDQGTDTNADGSYDNLAIDVGVNVTKAGNYTISGQLVDSTGIFVVNADTEASLDVGMHTVRLNFDGQTIHQCGVDGAFNLSACLYNADTLTTVDEMFNGYSTAAYSHIDFQAPPAKFSDSYSDCGVDTNGDGLFDCLTIEVGIDVVSAGDYGVSGILYDQNGAYVGSASSHLSLDAGTQTGQLHFDCQTIREHGLNGPYNLTSLTLYNESGKQIDYQDMVYTTSAYSYTDFQTRFVEFNDIFSDHGTDTDGDGKYNYMAVAVGITVNTPGNYAITGTLNDCNGNHTVWVVNHTSLDEGTQTVQLNFDGQTIRQHGVDGPYNLTYLEIYNADVRDIDRRDDVHTTWAYSYTDFEIPSAQLNDIFSDHGTDLDDDELYDYLTVDVGVNVTEAGNYSLEGRLADNNGNFMVSDYNYTTGLDAGSLTIQLNFDGLAIRTHGIDGPYHVRNLRLCDESGDTLDSRTDAHTTSAYNYTRFEAHPADLSLLESDIAFDPETPAAGETVIIAATICNTGTDDISSVVVQFFDGDPDAGGVQIGADQTIPGIANESTGTAQVTWTAIPGTHDIFVRVDPYNSVPEASENNNQAYKQITVGAIALPDLTLESEDIRFISPSSKSTQSSAHAVVSMENIDEAKIVAEAVAVESKEKTYQDVEIMDAPGRINSSWTTSPPTIDGTLESEEWVDAARINITYHTVGTCSMLVMNDEENLYIAFDVANDTTNDISRQDRAQLGFDGDHDNLIAPYDTDPFYSDGTCVDLWAKLRGNSTESRAGWLSMNENGTKCVRWYRTSDPTGPQVLATGFSDHRIYEYSIPFAIALNVSAGDTMGFNVLVNDGVGTADSDDFRTRGLWPLTWNGLCDFTADGDLTLATAPVAKPDLTLVGADISFSNANPVEGEDVTITATIHNVGATGADDVVVRFFDGDPVTGGARIDGDRTISIIGAGGTGTVHVTWTATPGIHNIFVVVDPDDLIPESDENNNQAYKLIAVECVSSTINSSWTTSPPMIDGTLENEEWDDAARINITYHSGGNCSMLVMNDEENLYIAFDVANDTTNDISWQDVAQLGFDGDHDNLIAPFNTDPFYSNGTCVDLWAKLRGNSTESRAGWLNIGENGTECMHWYSTSDPIGPQVLATGFSDHRIYEYSIPFTIALNVSAGDTTGFNVLVNDGVGTADSDDFRTQGLWPSTWNGLCDFTADGDLTLATTPTTEISALKATIHNIGTANASNVTVQFFDGNPDAGGLQIGADQTITSIHADGEESVSIGWIAETGAHDVYVRVDPFDSIQENNEENNIAFNTILLGD